ncbi:MAG: hypothetical protein Aurels2KO_37310 [Aureliella sp.]
MVKARGKLFIDPVVQGALVKRLVIHWLLFLTVTCVCIFAMEAMLGEPAASFAERLNSVWNKYGIMVLIMFAILPTFIYDTIKLSHRFAGPIYRLRSTFKLLAGGTKISQIKFREHDFWTEMAADFNTVLKRLEDSERRVAELEQNHTPLPSHNETTA